MNETVLSNHNTQFRQSKRSITKTEAKSTDRISLEKQNSLSSNHDSL